MQSRSCRLPVAGIPPPCPAPAKACRDGPHADIRQKVPGRHSSALPKRWNKELHSRNSAASLRDHLPPGVLCRQTQPCFPQSSLCPPSRAVRPCPPASATSASILQCVCPLLPGLSVP